MRNLLERKLLNKKYKQIDRKKNLSIIVITTTSTGSQVLSCFNFDSIFNQFRITHVDYQLQIICLRLGLTIHCVNRVCFFYIFIFCCSSSFYYIRIDLGISRTGWKFKSFYWTYGSRHAYRSPYCECSNLELVEILWIHWPYEIQWKLVFISWWHNRSIIMAFQIDEEIFSNQKKPRYPRLEWNFDHVWLCFQAPKQLFAVF